jgi:drug/metabolite transporter (DMT)-like permease
MAEQMAILMGLVAAACWGTTDFLAGRTARQIGVVSSLFFSQSLGLVALTVVVLVHPSLLPNGRIEFGISAAILAAVCNLVAMAALVKALAIGKASIVAPIVSLYGAVTTVLSVSTGQSLSAITILCLTLCILGASLASFSRSSDGKRESPASTGLALLSAMTFGFGFWLQGVFAVRQIGTIGTLWIGYLTAATLLFLILARNRSLSLPRGSTCGFVVLIGALSLLGFLSLTVGAKFGHVAIVTVLSSLASGVTVLLGFGFHKERPTVVQWVGILSIIIGVVALRMMDG